MIVNWEGVEEEESTLVKIDNRVDLERVRVEGCTIRDFWASRSKCGEKHLSKPIYRFSNGQLIAPKELFFLA